MYVCCCCYVCAQSYLNLCNPRDCSPAWSSVYGIHQARIPEWVDISCFMGLPDPGLELMSPVSPALAGGFFTTSNNWEANMYIWWREWLPTSVFLSGEFCGQRSLVDCSSWGCKVRHDWQTLTLFMIKIKQRMPFDAKMKEINLMNNFWKMESNDMTTSTR